MEKSYSLVDDDDGLRRLCHTVAVVMCWQKTHMKGATDLLFTKATAFNALKLVLNCHKIAKKKCCWLITVQWLKMVQNGSNMEVTKVEVAAKVMVALILKNFLF